MSYTIIVNKTITNFLVEKGISNMEKKFINLTSDDLKNTIGGGMILPPISLAKNIANYLIKLLK